MLVADDDHLMRWAIRETLLAAAVEVLEASTPQEALSALRGNDPEVAIVDVGLFRPASDALVQALAVFSRTQAVILTTSDLLSTNQRGVNQIDASAVLEKPVSLERLAAIVAEVLAHDGGARD